MNKKTFEEVILKLQLMREKSHKLYDLGVDLLEYTEPYERIIDLLFQSHFNKDQVGWIDWYLYEKPSLTKNSKSNQAWKTDEETGEQVEICYNIDSLWETICECGQQSDFDNRLGG
jgi:hypothetical protein